MWHKMAIEKNREIIVVWQIISNLSKKNESSSPKMADM